MDCPLVHILANMYVPGAVNRLRFFNLAQERRSRLIGELHAHAGSPPPVNDPNHPGGALNGGTIAKVVVIDRGVLFITPLLSDAVSDMSQSLFNQVGGRLPAHGHAT